MNTILRIAIQKSGRLSESSLNLIKDCGIQFSNGGGKLKSASHNFPMELLFLRDDDIPGYVEDGVADIGIIGENEMAEKKKDINLVKRLGFSKCRLSLAIPKADNYNRLHDLEGKSIATSYPNILNSYLREKGVKAEIHGISGSVEIAPGIGLADAICDIVSSGSTLLTNGLKEVESIFQSEAVLIANRTLEATKQDLLDQLTFRIDSVQAGKKNKYILLNAPNDKLDKIVQLLPGMKSPTVLPLATAGWSSIHSVITEDEFWERIQELRVAGAKGILIVPIEKMIL